jgi:hypothetical protein
MMYDTTVCYVVCKMARLALLLALIYIIYIYIYLQEAGVLLVLWFPIVRIEGTSQIFETAPMFAVSFRKTDRNCTFLMLCKNILYSVLFLIYTGTGTIILVVRESKLKTNYYDPINGVTHDPTCCVL